MNLLSPGSTFSGKELSTFVPMNHNNFHVGSFYFYELLSRKEHFYLKNLHFSKVHLSFYLPFPVIQKICVYFLNSFF